MILNIIIFICIYVLIFFNYIFFENSQEILNDKKMNTFKCNYPMSKYYYTNDIYKSCVMVCTNKPKIYYKKWKNCNTLGYNVYIKSVTNENESFEIYTLNNLRPR